MSQNKDRARLQALCKEITRRYGEETGIRMAAGMQNRWQDLCTTLSDYPPALHSHLMHNIFPAMAVFDALLSEGHSRPSAAKLTDDIFSVCMEPSARMIRILCKIPGIPGAMPGIWKKLAFKMFGEDAGFGFRVYETPKSQIKFDMVKCPYYDTCKKLGYTEIAPLFCHTDDICYGNMHRKLIWNRTKTLARGGDCCDFDLYVKK